MAEGDSAEDKTEAPTARRQQHARDDGQVPVSRELTSFAVLGAGALTMLMLAPDAVHGFALQLGRMVAQSGRADLPGGLGEVLRDAGWATLGMVVPPVAIAIVVAVLAVMLQSGFAVRSAILKFEPQRISPLAGIKRLVGAESAIEAVKSLVKTMVIGLVIWRVLSGQQAMLGATMAWGSRLLVQQMQRQVLHLVGAILAVQAVLAVLDTLWVRHRHIGRLRMTKEDLKQEMKDTEGNPLIKARLRQIRQMRARKRMMAAVPKATVVLTNPTHYAVALSYDRAANAAPRVVAKGVDEVAERIRAMAKEHGVPLVANPPLARALYLVDLDAEIPAEHYKAVAVIIAYVWRLNRRVRGAA